MVINIPEKLKNDNYRFYLIIKNGKLPLEKKWNSINNYKYNNPKLLEYLSNGYNVGIVTGFHNLVILDFDSLEFYKKIKPKLPDTFTVQTAKKRLFHYYYHLKGEPIRKIGIKDDTNRTILDIQSNGAGIVAPNSRIGNKGYDVYNDTDISTIELDTLKSIFCIDECRKARLKLYLDKTKSNPEEVESSIKVLEKHNIKRTRVRHFICPCHETYNKANLYVMDSGGVFCFSCQRWAKNGHEWVTKYTRRLIL